MFYAVKYTKPELSKHESKLRTETNETLRNDIEYYKIRIKTNDKLLRRLNICETVLKTMKVKYQYNINQTHYDLRKQFIIDILKECRHFYVCGN